MTGQSPPPQPSGLPGDAAAGPAQPHAAGPATAFVPAQPPAAPLTSGGSSSLADGEWHRMHPLTPLFKGGLALLIVVGVVLANMRDAIIFWFIRIFVPDEAVDIEYNNGDPVGWAIDWTLANNAVIYVSLAVLAVIAVVTGAFWLSWRKHEFRITGEHVEVAKGIVFRTHRRSPLDRVQGVNLTRPFPARLFGLAKLEVDGAGTDANVPMDYLSTARAEEIRSDILRLASGIRAAKAGHAPAAPEVHGLKPTLSAGVNELISGADQGDLAPESVVKIPPGRVIGSQLLDGAVWLVLVLIALAVPMTIALLNNPEERNGVMLGIGLGAGIPFVVVFVAVTWTQISKSLRYSIAPTPNGARITYGLLTSVTQTIPPGRIHAVEITQSFLWRPFGWWTIKVNRVSGQSASQQQSGQNQQFNRVLPVGTREDVERVLRVILPYLPAEDLPLVMEHGMDGPVAGSPDPYRTMARRGRWRRPFSWRRHGFAVSRFALMMRRGQLVWRKQAIFPLARMQSVSIAQGPVDRLQRVGWAQAHVVTGVISGQVVGLDREDLLALFHETRRGGVAAAAADQTHRWGAPGPTAAEQPAVGVAPSAGAGAAGTIARPPTP